MAVNLGLLLLLMCITGGVHSGAKVPGQRWTHLKDRDGCAKKVVMTLPTIGAAQGGPGWGTGRAHS